LTNTPLFFQATPLGFSNFNDYFGALSFRRGALCGTPSIAVAIAVRRTFGGRTQFYRL
jgi:hypothetical protein